MANTDKDIWLASMDEEMEAQLKCGAFELVHRKKGTK
jgi:hypothetical protein